MLNNLFKRKNTQQSNKAIFTLLAVFSALSLIAAFTLSFEKIHLLQNPNATLSCSVNVVLNCASVMKTDEASVFFGIPNSLFGMVGYAAALTLAVVLLTGAKLPRWMLISMQVAFGLGLVFALWLFFQSVYFIQVLCPWCLVVTVSSVILFMAMLRYNLRENVFNLSGKWHKRAKSWLEKDYDKLATASILALLVFLVLLKFRDTLFF